jgi:hypothetical protein
VKLRLSNPYPRQWIARDLDTDFFGVGRTCSQAIDDLWTQIEEAAWDARERQGDSSDLLLLLVGSIQSARELIATDKALVADAFLGRALQLMEKGMA